MEHIRKLSELKAGPVLVSQPAHLGFFISLNSFMYLDREIYGGGERRSVFKALSF